GGRPVYQPGFVEHYLMPVLYPESLTRELQMILGAVVVVLNISIYAYLWAISSNSDR
ncbi:MAG: DUF2784 family protein, partial [Deltaproteobacteria bacterium]|nr:DUF2784 family protein [Deltaproteobacteria bacterium]